MAMEMEMMPRCAARLILGALRLAISVYVQRLQPPAVSVCQTEPYCNILTRYIGRIYYSGNGFSNS
jgi:hypothetical protein